MHDEREARIAELIAQRPTARRLSCPCCDPNATKRPRTISLSGKDDGSVLYHCHRCGFSGCVPVVRPRRDSHSRPAAVRGEGRRRTLSDSPCAQALWAVARPIVAGDIGDAYLSARGCQVPGAKADLRFLARVRTPDADHEGPCLIALVRHAVTGESLTLHRTWINDDGTKAGPGRLLWSGLSKAGGVICLTERIGGHVLVGEGIESVLSVRGQYDGALACLDANGLAALPIIPGVRTLTIAVDFDEAGIHGAQACAQRWHAAGRAVTFLLSPSEYLDANDCVRRGLRLLHMPFDPEQSLVLRALRMVWNSCVPVADVPDAIKAFHMQGWAIPARDADVRVRRGLLDPRDGSTAPRLVFRTTDARTGLPRALHMVPLVEKCRSFVLRLDRSGMTTDRAQTLVAHALSGREAAEVQA